MLPLLVVSLAIGQIHGHPITGHFEGLEPYPPLFVKALGQNNTPLFEPYDRFNYSHWKPDSSLYGDVLMVEKQTTVNGETITYQDFNISALTLEQFKQYIMSTPDFVNPDGSFIYSDLEAQKYR